jgi:hypothetical protein
VDAIFTIMWLSAFAAVASFNSSGKCGDGCKLSEATVGLGVFVWYVLFVIFSNGSMADRVFLSTGCYSFLQL